MRRSLRLVKAAVLAFALLHIGDGGIATPFAAAAAPSTDAADESSDQSNDRAKAARAGAVRHYVAEQVDWVRSKGGFVSDKLEFRRVDGSDPESTFGVFAPVDLKKGEVVMKIPQVCLLGTDDGSHDVCRVVVNLAKQRQLGSESDFEPYVSYMYDGNSMEPIPSAYSDEGKRLMDDVVGIELPTAGTMTRMTYDRFCRKSISPKEEAELPHLDEAYAIWLRRAWEEKMLPLYDIVNHRNGNYTNVDITSPRKKGDVQVFATRDIRAGEQLYGSYNNSTDSVYPLTYVLQHILRDFGFVEQYPRRWIFRPAGWDLVFELDEKDSGELEVRWLQDERTWGPPETWKEETVLRYFRGHLQRLKDLGQHVAEGLEKLKSRHERDTIEEFYQAKMTALQHAIWSAQDLRDASERKGEDEGGGVTYDQLDGETEDFEQVSGFICDVDREWERYGKYEWMDEIESHYQTFKFDRRYDEHDKEKVVDTCLHINGRLNVCSSLRPHYHEPLIQYPARLLDKPPKRVLFMGGGDNMVLAEVLKFPSLEVVVGLELDQRIVRSSFNYFRTQPHFDDPRVEWWFGDAAKSFLMLPQDYYGSFDLVLVDLESDVIDMVRVREDLNIMDAALLLLAPGGVISRNVDFGFDSTHRFTQYGIDIHDVDIPMFCYLGLKVGSNSVDLLAQTPTDHGVETLYLPPVEDMQNPFEWWYNYRSNATHTLRMDSCCKEFLANSKGGGAGVLMILEAEEALSPLDSLASVQDSISQALKEAGLTEIASEKGTGEMEGGGSAMFILQEGYVVARVWPEMKYVAFDIHLWSNFDDLDLVRTELLAAVGSKVEGRSSSSYRIVASGMVFPENEDSGSAACPCDSGSGEEAADPIQNAAVMLSATDTVLAESLKLIQVPNATVAIVCGENGRSCSAVETLSETGFKVATILTCSEGNESLLTGSCIRDTLSSLRDFVETSGKLGGIVIAPEVPRSMGQVLHKALNSTKVRRELLTENVVVLEASSSTPSEARWRTALLDRFRTDFVRFDPAYRAELLFNDTGSGGSMRLGVFSAGDHLFFSHLVKSRASIVERTGFASEVRSIKNGRNNYYADFTPTPVTHDDYDHRAADEQFRSQIPLGRQTVLQFKMGRMPDKKLSAKEVKKGLKQAFQNAFAGMEDEDMETAAAQGHSVGKGCVISASWSTGNAVLLWNGIDRVDINLFTYSQDADLHTNFEEEFEAESRQPLTVLSRDEQPRGVGRVVNFQSEIDRPDGYVFGDEELGDDEDSDDDEEEEEYDDDEEEAEEEEEYEDDDSMGVKDEL